VFIAKDSNMRYSEFVTESISTPYDMNFQNNVSWNLKGSRKSKGVSADFKTSDGIKYVVRGMYIGPTKKERDDDAAYKAAIERKRAAGKDEIYLPSTLNDRYGGIWEVHFDMFDEADPEGDRQGYKNKLTGTGDEFRVFATIIAFIQRLISEFHPVVVSIKSDNSEPKRVSLYAKLAKRFASQVGYEVVKTTVTGDTSRMELRKIDK